MAKAKKEKKPSSGKSGKKKGMMLPFMLLLSMGGIYLVKYAFIFFLIGILPSLAAYISDRSRGRLVFQIVMACNLCGVFPYLGNLIANNSSDEVFFSTITNPTVWIVMYGAALVGWVIVSFTPTIALFILNQVNAVKIMKLQSTQKQLVNEWGSDIKRKRE